LGVRYANREDIKNALDTRSTTRTDAQIDRALASGSKAVNDLCHRLFYPQLGVRYFDWPDENEPYGKSWRLWLHQHEAISVTSLVAGGVTIPSSDYHLEPVNDGPPYTHIEIDRSSNAAFGFVGTPQRAIVVTGVFGGWDEEERVATVSGTITAAHSTLTFTPEQVGVGDTVHIDDEYIHLVGLGYADSGQNLGGAGLAASTADVSVPVSNGSGFVVGETIRIDGEAMQILAITGDTLTVRRAHDGSVLAAHTAGVDIYAERAFKAQRGALGSVAAEHLDGTNVYRLVYPPLVKDLAVAETLTRLQNEQSGYARPISNFHKSVIDAPATGINALREDCYASHARRMRTRAI
jgi:hypothetical protein